MKFGHYGVYDLVIFNEKDELIAKLDTLKESNLYPTNDGYMLVAKDALLNTDFLKFIGNESKVSDYEKYLGKKGTTISISKNNSKTCKIIAKTSVVESETHKKQAMTIEIPLAYTVSQPAFLGNGEEVTVFDAAFKIYADEKTDEYFKLHI